MTISCQHMTMEELVDVLAQKTQIFTQLLVEKKFDEEYKQCKQEIQRILAEIEIRKEKPDLCVLVPPNLVAFLMLPLKDRMAKKY